MKSILKELYSGNIDFTGTHYNSSSPYIKAAKKNLDIMETLTKTLNDSQKELFEKYCDAQGDIEHIANYDTFSAAFRFGVLLMIEVFKSEKINY